MPDHLLLCLALDRVPPWAPGLPGVLPEALRGSSVTGAFSDFAMLYEELILGVSELGPPKEPARRSKVGRGLCSLLGAQNSQ